MANKRRFFLLHFTIVSFRFDIDHLLAAASGLHQQRCHSSKVSGDSGTLDVLMLVKEKRSRECQPRMGGVSWILRAISKLDTEGFCGRDQLRLNPIEECIPGDRRCFCSSWSEVSAKQSPFRTLSSFVSGGVHVTKASEFMFFRLTTMIDDEGLEIYANLLGMFIFFLLIVYHYVTANPNYEGH
ncbi:hypothetical protein ACFX14_001257 [Malus domestica]